MRAVTVVELVTLTLLANVPPKLSVAPATKFEPVTVTVTPPAVLPVFGEIDVMAGGDGDGSEPPDAGNIVLSFFRAPGEVFK